MMGSTALISISAAVAARGSRHMPRVVAIVAIEP